MNDNQRVFKHVPTYNLRDLDFMTLQIRVVEDSGITTILGVETETGKVYVIDVKGVV